MYSKNSADACGPNQWIVPHNDSIDLNSHPLSPFHFREKLNILKTNKYTIISIDNFEKNMAKMDRNEPITYLEMVECFFMLLDCVVRH